ncbi:hypothetical protein JTE90_015274 [Oedothorax gibbosus]|uniref:Ankyrin repeat protein n=1 Tax=Oedothorax gibbosus TaxID=931172 RepID=A0AAV6UC60_9ARAC|nr:hypothetical protein JTE90_015274 [Oedothorax gibbosus]
MMGWPPICNSGTLSYFSSTLARNVISSASCPTLLYQAFEYTPIKVLKFIARHPNTDMNLKATCIHRPALIQSVRFSLTEVVEFMIRAGADISVRDDKGRTILHYACTEPSWSKWKKGLT